jgi:alkylation response protein AidB-like acyl-CoA dehydrogenase
MAATGSSELLREATRGFLAREAPLSAVRASLERPRALDRAAWARAASMGWIAALLPEEHGGLGVDLTSAVTIAEELGRGLYGGPFLGCALAAWAWPEIAGLADGETTAAWCELAPAGSVGDDDAPRTGGGARNGAPARLTGVGRHVFDADVADVLVVATAGGAFLVDAEHAHVAPEPGLDLTRTISTVTLDDAPATPIAAQDPRPLGALLAAADAVGVAARLLELTVEYAKQRTTFGRTLASYQAVKHKCADMLCDVEGSRAAVTAAAAAPSERAITIAKAYATERCARVAGEALQIHGGIGFTWEHDLHLYLRRAKADEAMFPRGYAALA